jgi:hypothetical protein
LLLKQKLVLTQLGPDVSEAGIPKGHIEFVIAGEEDGLVEVGPRGRFCRNEG